MSFKQWQNMKKNVEASNAWASNSVKIDSQNRFRYKKIVRLHLESMQFCGQAYAGANNYHTMPTCLKEYIENAIKDKFMVIVEEAIAAMAEDSYQLSILAEDEVKGMLIEISANKS